MTTPLISPHPLLGAGVPPPMGPLASARTDEELRAAAAEFEIQFLSEMLTHAGFGKPRSEMGGGPGEEAFACTWTGIITRVNCTTSPCCPKA